MEEMILDAFERIPTNKRFVEEGFIAGVMYGDGVKEATSIKVQDVELIKILKKHGSNAKIWIKYGEDKKFGFIKEIQRHPVTAKINHIDVQLVSKDREIKMQLPISFKGEENVAANLLELKVYKAEIDVIGSMGILPDGISIDISQKILGDTITIKDFDLNKQIKVTDDENQIYAAIAQMKEEVTEEVTAEAVVAETEAK
ncbi:50S ribosomal protein L25 [Clostridium estertheticum]|uniref:50S ribosomal protein L25 n=1 Tax=Clostridium estertheticum TaxID=238834 RepID=UPI0013EE45DE|nr:50S ribosomal protein L25 [Clostridium estertheticum]MBZ9607064.1 50S ribosomal protein L25 [Clostridium estertheticum]